MAHIEIPPHKLSGVANPGGGNPPWNFFNPTKLNRDNWCTNHPNRKFAQYIGNNIKTYFSPSRIQTPIAHCVQAITKIHARGSFPHVLTKISKD